MKYCGYVFSFILIVACGGDDAPSTATCLDVCQVAIDCGTPISSCEATCETMTTQSQRACIVTASSCVAVNACLSIAGSDAGRVNDAGSAPADSGGGGVDAGNATDGGASCRCNGSINGDRYDVACDELFCADGLEHRCIGRGSVRETGEVCEGGSCVELGGDGCGGGNNCCDIPGGTPVCRNSTCCQLNGPATSRSNCCFVFLDDGTSSCCTTPGADVCE